MAVGYETEQESSFYLEMGGKGKIQFFSKQSTKDRQSAAPLHKKRLASMLGSTEMDRKKAELMTGKRTRTNVLQRLARVWQITP